MKLLHLDSSALGSQSATRELSAAIVANWKRNDPALQVSYRDLVRDPLPHWTPDAGATDAAARSGSTTLDEFLAADVVVIGAPMYNFGIPSQLKAWIDRIAVAGKTFTYGPSGAVGLAGGKRVIIASTRGGMFAPGTAYAALDHQESYLKSVFGFLGITDIQ